VRYSHNFIDKNNVDVVCSNSDLLLSSLSPPPMLPPGNQSDTSDMARGLGYLLGGLSDDHTLLDTDDHLEVRNHGGGFTR